MIQIRDEPLCHSILLEHRDQRSITLDAPSNLLYNFRVGYLRGPMSHEELNAYEQEIDVLENTVEILIDKLHELVSEGNHAEAQAIAQQINTLG